MEKTGLKETIQHDGIVQKTDGKSVIVKITSKSACSGCHAEASCTLTGNEEKLVTVSGNYTVKAGDAVTVLMCKSMGYAAVLLGYLLPLVVILIILIILTSFSVPELTAGLLSIAVLIPYFTLLYLFRSKIDKKFTFTIKA